MSIYEPKSALAGLRRWSRAALVAMPVLAAQALVPATWQALTGSQVAMPGVAQAQEREIRRTPALRNPVYERLAEAQAAAEEEKYGDAIRILNELRGRTGAAALNSYELANLYNMYAFIHYTQEDYARALESYRQVVAQPDIPIAMETNTRFTIAQLFFVQERWRDGIAELNRWFELTESPTAQAHMLLGQAYYQLEDFNRSLENVNRAMDMERSRGRVPAESWYALQRFLYFNREDYARVIQILEEMLVHYPKKEYWVQLSHMYGETRQERKQLSAMETAYRQGLLDRETEITNLAYLMLANEVPYKAARVLEQGMKDGVVQRNARNLELLGNAWRASQELRRSIPVMEEAARRSDEGEIWARLANIYVDNEEFDKAIEAAREALRKGGVRRPDSTQLVLGMALFNTQQYDAARRAFREAARDNRSRTHAEQWLNYMETEIERQRSLREV